MARAVLLVAMLMVCVFVLFAKSGATPLKPRRVDLTSTLFESFKTRYNKQYASDAEEERRFAAFSASINRIAERNSRNTQARFGLTRFSDLTPDEFRQMYLGYKPSDDVSLPLRDEDMEARMVMDLPDSFDWRTKGAVTHVYDQGQCGSCWAFSATENIESMWFLANHTLPNLSPQQIVDCSWFLDFGCGGGDPRRAFDYVKHAHGQAALADYPYMASRGHCEKHTPVAHISGWQYATRDRNETLMQQSLVALGPLSICVQADVWQDYEGGVITASDGCGERLDHCVQLVGYGTDGTTPYWIVRNSWSEDWGEQGYVRVERNGNVCGIAKEVSTAVI